MTPINRQITLAARPHGFPQDSDFKLIEQPVPTPGEGELLVQVQYLSVDPYMRGRMNDTASYANPVGIGDVMVGECVGKVIQSRNSRFSEGSFVSGMFGWQEYAVSNGVGVRRLDPNLAPLSTALHVLGMPGLTAYFGLVDVCQAKENETIVISAAAGAVGSTAGQLSNQRGCRVVGIAGTDEKVKFVTDELGMDAAFNYKTTDNYHQALKELCPNGIDAYFDNVGGPITDAVFPLLNERARVGICGQIAIYNTEEPSLGPRLFWHLIVKRATVRGFLVMDYVARFREGLEVLGKSFSAGELKYRERITDGIERAPTAFIEMMQGANIGKQLVKVSEV
jgi:NADPH-dependent curcumin reductase CurA